MTNIQYDFSHILLDKDKKNVKMSNEVVSNKHQFSV